MGFFDEVGKIILGPGQTQKQEYTCPTCRGQGILPGGRDSSLGDGQGAYVNVRCSDCGGSGKILK